MIKFLKIFLIFIIIFILVVVIPNDSKSNVLISNNFPINVGTVAPCLKYQINNNMYPFVNLSKSTIGAYGDDASIYVNTTWWSGITTDNYGNTYYVDTMGDLFVNYSKKSTLWPLGTPYSEYPWYGPVVGVAVSNNTISQGGALVQELTEWGVVFELNVTNQNTISQGWHGWILPYAGKPNTLFSSIAEIKSINYYIEIFMYFAVNGTIYYYEPQNGAYNIEIYTLTTAKAPGPIISACAYGYYNFNTGYYVIESFGLLYNGNIYINSPSGWTYFSTTSNGARTINIGPLDNRQFTSNFISDSEFYLLVSMLNSNTYVYESDQLNYQSSSTTFSEISIPTIYGTNEAIAQPWGDGWYILQTNGTIAHSSNWINPTSWSYFYLKRFNYIYQDILNITNSCNNIFTIYSKYNALCSYGISNLMYFNLTFYKNNKNILEFVYNMGSFYNYSKITNVNKNNPVLVNISFTVNDAYNSTLCFYVIIYPKNNLNIIVTYQFKIVMINHFSYIPI